MARAQATIRKRPPHRTWALAPASLAALLIGAVPVIGADQTDGSSQSVWIPWWISR